MARKNIGALHEDICAIISLTKQIRLWVRFWFCKALRRSYIPWWTRPRCWYWLPSYNSTVFLALKKIVTTKGKYVWLSDPSNPYYWRSTSYIKFISTPNWPPNWPLIAKSRRKVTEILRKTFRNSSTFPSEILRISCGNHLEKLRKSRQLLEEIT